MKIQEDKTTHPYAIRAYTEQGITVGDRVLRKSFLLLPDKLLEFEPQSLDALTQNHLNPILAAAPEILLVGTGMRFKQMPQALHNILNQHHVHIECMNTKSACRSYIILLSESRNVGALFFQDTL